MYYFAYGSNMNLDQMKDRCKDGYQVKGVCQLDGFELGFDSHGYANLRPLENSVVYGVLFSIEEKHLKILDIYEGYLETPQVYDRKLVNVKCQKDDKKYQAWMYFEDPNEFGHEAKKEYLKIIIKGAEQNLLPIKYIAFLDSLI